MRGDRHQEDQLFSYIPLEDRVPTNHPLRSIRAFVDPILKDLSPRFDAIYSKYGRPSIPPEAAAARSAAPGAVLGAQ